MNYITSLEFAKKHGITSRMVAYYCNNHQISGAVKKGKTWLIPMEAEKPFDRRRKSNKNVEDSIAPAINGSINDLDRNTFENRYRIQELHDFIGVTREGIRYYEKLGLIEPIREEENNYRTFGGYDIFHLMAIDFYRKRGFSSVEIKNFFQISEPNKLLDPMEQKEKELLSIIHAYQKTLHKLQSTKAYISSLEDTYNILSMQPLPSYEIKSTFSTFTAFYEYQEKVLNAKSFTNDDILSHLLRTLYFNEEGYTGSQMSIIEKSETQFTSTPCIYMRVSADNNDELFADTMLVKCRSWAEERNIQLQGTAHIFIQLVLFGENVTHSYYDVYVPIK